MGPHLEGADANHGWEDYREHHLKPELAESENFRYRYFAIEPLVRDGMAWAPYRYGLSVAMRGQYTAMDGIGTAVLEKRSGRWVIVHLLLHFPLDMASSASTQGWIVANDRAGFLIVRVRECR